MEITPFDESWDMPRIAETWLQRGEGLSLVALEKEET
jgi:hypothetical protein